jgi:hypothetical protein
LWRLRSHRNVWSEYRPDFVITKTKFIGGVEIATEIEDAQETPSAVIDDTSLVIHRYTLRSAPKSCISHP